MVQYQEAILTYTFQVKHSQQKPSADSECKSEPNFIFEWFQVSMHGNQLLLFSICKTWIHTWRKKWGNKCCLNIPRCNTRVLHPSIRYQAWSHHDEHPFWKVFRTVFSSGRQIPWRIRPSGTCSSLGRLEWGRSQCWNSGNPGQEWRGWVICRATVHGGHWEKPMLRAESEVHNIEAELWLPRPSPYCFLQSTGRTVIDGNSSESKPWKC